MLKEKRREGSIPYRGKCIAKWYMGRSPGKYNQRGDSQREVKRTFKMLREVWLNIKTEKIDTYEDIIVKVFLDSGTDRDQKVWS